MTEQQYNSYSADDFLNDQDFLRYIKYNQAEDVTFWESWQQQSPANFPSFAAAKLQLEVILSARALPVPARFEANLLQSINESINTVEKTKKQSRFKLQLFSGIAASLIIGLFISWYFASSIVIHADYATPKLVHLPDGSEVQLNANSTLTYARAFNWKHIREVQLSGEAYFKVKHLNKNLSTIKNGDRFKITTNNLLVEVLGTEFNLKDRRNRAELMLIKGKVLVKSLKTAQSYVIKPGSAVLWHANQLQLKDQAHSLVQTAWLTGKLLVNQTSARAIIDEFEDLYGYHVILEDPTKENKKIDGVISVKSEDAMLFVISHILKVNVKKEGKIIYLLNDGN